MQETLHLSSSTSTATATNTTAAGTIPFPSSLSRPKHLHFPSPPSSKHTISLPQIPPLKEHVIPPTPITSPPNHSQSLQEKLLYLDSLGIDSFHCLTSNPPIIQTPLSEIKSVIEFLYSIGLTTPDLRRAVSMCPDTLTTPLTSTLIPAVTFLLREAHVDSCDLRHVIHRRPRLLTRSVDDTLRPTLDFLQSTIGIDDVSKWAPLLSCSVQSKFIPRMEYVQKLGFSSDDTVLMFRRFPSLFCYSIAENFEPKFDYFVVEMGRELRELVDFPQYFSFSLDSRIKPRHQMCVEKGVFLSLSFMLKSSEGRFRRRLGVFCSSTLPVRNSPLWCSTSKCTDSAQFDVNVT